MNRPGKPPRSPYTRRSTAEEVTADFDLAGKIVLITGCNAGIMALLHNVMWRLRLPLKA